MVDLKGEDEESVDSALSQQVNAENSSKEDKLETSSESEKPVKRQEPVSPHQQSGSLKMVIIIVAVVLLLIILLVVAITVIVMLNGGERELTKDANIEEAKIADEKTAYVILSDGVNLSALESIEIIFSDAKNNKYGYYTTSITKEYEISATSANLSSFENITSVSISFTFKSTPAPPVNNTNTTNPTFVMCTDSCSSLGKNCGNWTFCNKTVNCGNCSTGTCNSTGQCSVSCFDECANEGLSCQGNMSYNCSVGTDRCLHRTNLTMCGTGQECFNGTCIVISECSSNSTCFSNTSLTNICSIGFCSSTSRCQAIYNSSAQICRNNVSECDMPSNCTGSSGVCPSNINKTDGIICSIGKCSVGKCVNCTSEGDCGEDKCYGTEFRDYSCNSTNGCQYNVITKEENLTNGNCEDGKDNDCDLLVDTADSGCVSISVCGNNVKEGDEVCDGTDLAGETCTDLGFVSGTLACLGDCSNYDTSQCSEVAAPSMSPWVRFWKWLFG